MTNSTEGAMPPLPEEIEAAINKFGNMCSFGSFDASLESVKELRASIQAYAAPLLARVAELEAERDRLKGTIAWVRAYISRYDPPGLPNHIVQRLDEALAANKEQP